MSPLVISTRLCNLPHLQISIERCFYFFCHTLDHVCLFLQYFSNTATLADNTDNDVPPALCLVEAQLEHHCFTFSKKQKKTLRHVWIGACVNNSALGGNGTEANAGERQSALKVTCNLESYLVKVITVHMGVRLCICAYICVSAS